MAVAGLRPQQASQSGRNSNASMSSAGDHQTLELESRKMNENCRFSTSQQKQNLVCMIQFATSLMVALNSINKQSFQMFKLRIGLHTGDVIAGVIGAQRKFYDIWGDCVNVSSKFRKISTSEEQ